MQRKQIAVSLLTLFFVASLAFGAAGEKAKINGMIITRTGKTDIGPDV